jgi:hypothetical protein
LAEPVPRGRAPPCLSPASSPRPRQVPTRRLPPAGPATHRPRSPPPSPPAGPLAGPAACGIPSPADAARRCRPPMPPPRRPPMPPPRRPPMPPPRRPHRQAPPPAEPSRPRNPSPAEPAVRRLRRVACRVSRWLGQSRRLPAALRRPESGVASSERCVIGVADRLQRVPTSPDPAGYNRPAPVKTRSVTTLQVIRTTPTSRTSVLRTCLRWSRPGRP